MCLFFPRLFDVIKLSEIMSLGLIQPLIGKGTSTIIKVSVSSMCGDLCY